MQIGALGFVNSAAMPKGNVQSRTGQSSSFANLLSGLVQPQNSSLDVEKIATEDTEQLSNEKIIELIQFLNSSDLTDIKFGTVLTDDMLADVGTNMSDLVKVGLQLSDENILTAITEFLKGINLDTEKENVSLSEEEDEEELSNVIEGLPRMDLNEAMAALINILPNINLDQTALTTDQNFAYVAKSLKILELLSNYEKPAMDQQQIKDFLQKTIEKLEVQLKENVSSNRYEFLNKVFTPIGKDVNQQDLMNRQMASVIPSTGQSISEISSEKAVLKQTIVKEVDQKSLMNRQTYSVLPLTDQSINEFVSGETVIKQNDRIVPIMGDLFSIQPMTKPEQLTLIQGQSGKLVSTELLIQQFEDILSKSQLLNTGGNQKLFIKLYPEHLGALRIELMQKESMLTAKIMTSTSTTKDILESQIQSLKNAFSLHNIQVERIEISQQEQFLNKEPQQQQEQKQQSQQRQQRQQEEQKQHEQQFMVSFEEELINAKV